MSLRALLPGLFSVWIVLTAGCRTPAVAGNDAGSFYLKGTRSWIRVSWENVPGANEYRLYWNTGGTKPESANAVVAAGKHRFYIQEVTPETAYTVWMEAVEEGTVKKTFTGSVTAAEKWELDPLERRELALNPSSAAVPAGMLLFWHDEFNDELLNRNKWSTNYYSSIDYLYRSNFEKMKADELPRAAYILNGKTINLFTNDSLPKEVYDIKNNKKISSIQTYDWRRDENLLDNSRGGYFEVRVKRSSTGKPRGLNTAFWFDSPGPDLKYYLEEGTVLDGVTGIRPKGQVFEIDVFEYLNAQFVLHGHVDTNGKFQRNLATHIAEGYKHIDNWVVHGMLWTPTAIKHYINGNLIKAYSDKHRIYAPNHFMNVLLGAYGGGGTVNMEVDYIRYYQWPLKEGNELPNPGFEDGGALAPWEGDGVLTPDLGRNNTTGVVLKPGQQIEQYVYLDNDTGYELKCWLKGGAGVSISTEDMTPVSGHLTETGRKLLTGKSEFVQEKLSFITGKEFGNHKKTVRVCLANNGPSQVIIDDIVIRKGDHK